MPKDKKTSSPKKSVENPDLYEPVLNKIMTTHKHAWDTIRQFLHIKRCLNLVTENFPGVSKDPLETLLMVLKQWNVTDMIICHYKNIYKLCTYTYIYIYINTCVGINTYIHINIYLKRKR